MNSARVAPLLLVVGALGCGFNDSGLGDAPDLVPDPLVEGRPDTAVATQDSSVADSGVLEDATEVLDAPREAAVDATPEVRVDTPPPCPEAGSVTLEGRCYFVLPTPRAFGDARLACAAMMPAAHLVTITSAAEQAKVNALAGKREGWIGLRKDDAAPVARESFKWITNEPATFNGWAPEDPNGGHNCARLRSDGTWGDMACPTLLVSICERD